MFSSQIFLVGHPLSIIYGTKVLTSEQVFQYFSYLQNDSKKQELVVSNYDNLDSLIPFWNITH